MSPATSPKHALKPIPIKNHSKDKILKIKTLTSSNFPNPKGKLPPQEKIYFESPIALLPVTEALKAPYKKSKKMPKGSTPTSLMP
jgi:hypothetical protein